MDEYKLLDKLEALDMWMPGFLIQDQHVNTDVWKDWGKYIKEITDIVIDREKERSNEK